MKTISDRQVELLDSSIAAVLPNIELQGLAGKRLFITGGTGFFGLWILSALRLMHKLGLDVQVSVLSRDPKAFLSKYKQFQHQSWLNFNCGDIKDFNIWGERFDFLLHAATETSMQAHADELRLFDDILFGARRVFQVARLAEVKRILLVSSGAVYGLQDSKIVHQPDDSLLACDPWRRGSAYGEGKRVMELMGAMLERETGIECLSARCFTFCGPGLPLDGHFAVGNFIRDALYGKQITVRGNGKPRRSYLFGADLALWLFNLLLKGDSGYSYNVGSDEALTVKELAFKVRDLIAPNIPVKILQSDNSESLKSLSYVPNISRAREIGCNQWTTLSESLLLTASYYREK